ncbi:MAG: Ig-like domain repeat protein [Deltaproteobacteria bacterium]|nr:Ig-like domain repeat protein [Deltaproteobacteria bacterium]
MLTDYTAPELFGKPVLSKKYAKKGDEVTLSFKVTEDLAVDPVVSTDPAPVPFAKKSSSGREYQYSHVVTDADPEEFLSVIVNLKDAAGNESHNLYAGELTIDRTPPGLDGAVTADRTALRVGTNVQVRFGASECLSDNPVVKLGNVDMSFGGQSDRSYTYNHTADTVDDAGDKQVLVTLVDLAGNMTTGLPGPTVAFDSTIADPTVVSLDAGPHKSPAGMERDTLVHLVFETHEQLDPGAGEVVVKMGTNSFACPSGKSSSFDCAFTVPRDLQSGNAIEGTRDVFIELKDAAGNANNKKAGAVTFDFTRPTLRMAVQPNGRPVRLGEMFTVTVTSDEALDANGVQLDSGALNLGAPSVSGFSSTWSYLVKPSDNSGYNLSATAKDLAGNAVAAPLDSAVTFDGVVPAVSGTQLNPGRIKGGQTFTLTFTLSEAVTGDPAVTFSNGVDAPVTMARTGRIGNVYTYQGTAPASGSAMFYSVAVAVTDDAGNQTTASAGTIEIDNVAPQLAGLEVAPAGAKKNDTVRVVLTADETLSGPPAVTATAGVATITFTPQDSTPGKLTYVYTYVVTDGTTQGVYIVQPVTLLDIAGNTNTITPSPARTFSVDSSTPTVTTGPTFGKSPAIYKSGETISLGFTTSEDLDASLPRVTLNTATAKSLPCTAGLGINDYTCAMSAALAGTETPQGLVGVSIELTDAAGNMGFASSTVTLDFTPPQKISAKPGQDAYKLNDGILYTINVSEALAGTPGRPTVRVYKGGTLEPAFFGDPVQETDTSFSYVKTVTGGMDGSYTVELDLTDKAGNTNNNVAGDPFSVDSTPPTVTPGTLTSNNPNSNTLAKNGEVVTAVFSVSEELSADPSVTIGGQTMNFVSKTGAVPGPFTYTYTRTAVTADGDGLKIASVTASDKAGNIKVQDVGSVTYDFTAPSVATGSESVQLIPFPGCLLTGVMKVAPNTTVRATFTATEMLLNDPSVSLSPSAGTWSITKYSSSGNSFTYNIKPTGGSPSQGATSVRVVLTDKAGNVSNQITLNLPAPGIDVDTVAPTPITAAQNDKLRYRRIPWGSDATAGIKTYSVTSQVGSVEPNSTVIFWDDANMATASEIGRTVADATGAFPEVELIRADRTAVYVSQLDPAGNIDTSTATEIKNVEWVATMGYKVPESTLGNPSTLKTTGFFWPRTLEQDPVSSVEPSQADLAWVTRIDSSALVRGLADARNWLDKSTVPSPTPRSHHAMCYDSDRSTVVLFGGNDGGYRNDTWEFQDMGWAPARPATKPPARFWHAMAYDTTRHKTVLFGGLDDGVQRGDTWEYDGIDWRQVNTAATPGRYGHAMAYDSERKKVVMFGGCTGDLSSCTPKNSTWEYDGTNWVPRSPTSAPTSRSDTAMAYDSIRKKVVLFGGGAGQEDDTWEWDGTNWVGIVTVAEPLGRRYHAMAFDTARGKTVLFGGSNGGDETWEYDGTNWIQVNTGVKPPAHQQHAIAYDLARASLVVFGGYAPSTLVDDTWTLEGGKAAMPGQTMEVPFIAAETSVAKTILSVGARFYAGGVGYTGGAPASGTNLLAWDTVDAAWTVRATNTSGPGAPNLVQWSTSDTDTLNRLFSGDQQTLNFAVTPAYPNGSDLDLGQIAVDYAEVVVKYRQ